MQILNLCRQVPEQSWRLILRFHKAAPAARQALALGAAQPVGVGVKEALALAILQAPALVRQAEAQQAQVVQLAEVARLPAEQAAQAQAVQLHQEILVVKAALEVQQEGEAGIVLPQHNALHSAAD